MTQERIDNKKEIIKMMKNSLKEYEVRLKFDSKSIFFKGAVENTKNYIQKLENEVLEAEKLLNTGEEKIQ